MYEGGRSGKCVWKIEYASERFSKVAAGLPPEKQTEQMGMGG
jgi:hypothetical protein